MTHTSKRLVALLLVVFALSGVVQAKSFRFQSIEQDVFFRADGTVRVLDVRTYAFSGTYSNAFLNVDPRSGGSVRFEGVEAIDGKAAANPRIEGNKISWSSPATDETRTFRIAYVLSGDLQVAADAAQFDRQVLEPVHAPVDRYVVRLHTPAQNPSLYRVFVFTGRSRIGQLKIDTPSGMATVSLAPVSENEFVRTRVLLPANQFTNRTISGNKFSAWIEEVRRETQGFRDASRGALEKGGFAPAPPPPPPTPWYFLLLPFLGLAYVVGSVWDAYTKYGREPHTVDVGRYYREPAEDIPPSVVPFVLTQSGGGSLGPAVSATLLDFARKGFVSLEKRHNAGLFGIGASDETDFRLEKEPTGNLTPFETNLWRVLRSSDNGGVVTPGALRSTFQNSTSLAPSLTAMPRQWYEVTKGSLVDQGASKFTSPVVIVAFVVAVISFVLGFFLVGLNTAIGIALIIAGVLTLIVAIIASQILPRWNADKLLNAKRWVAYRNFLSDFSQMETAPAEHYKLWDYHFVYATALGVAQAYLRNLRRIEESRPGTIYAPIWLGSYSGGSSGGLPTALDLTSLNSLESIASNLKSLESGLSPKSEGSGGGFGGGSSGGSSGGGGSSGAN